MIRLLSKLHLFAKIDVFGAFLAKFFDRMCAYALKISQKIRSKTFNFFQQSEFRKKSIGRRELSQRHLPSRGRLFRVLPHSTKFEIALLL